MHSALNNNLFLVKEHVGLFKAANNFDIYDMFLSLDDSNIKKTLRILVYNFIKSPINLI